MKDFKSRPQVVFLLVGILLLVIAFLLATLTGQSSEAAKFWADSIKTVAFIILTIVVIDFLWQIIGGEPVRETLGMLAATLAEMRSSVCLLENSKTTGLTRLFAVSGALGSHREWMQRLKGTRSQIDLLGYTLHVWTRGENFEQEIISLVRAGVKVRILIMDEINPNFKSFINEKQITSISFASVQEEVKVAKQAFRSIASIVEDENARGSFEFRTLKDGLIVCQLCRTDSRITAVQYLYSVVGSRSPIMDIRGNDTELFRLYSAEFESLWDLGETA